MKKRKAAYIQVTRKCNNECIFCSNPQFDKEYSFEEAKERMKEFKEQGITEIILTGGEPTKCDFLFDFIKFIKNKKMDFKMISNGVLLADESFVKELRDSGLTDINISIHSHDEKTSDKLTQKKGHWKKTIKAVENCIQNSLNVNINTTINTENCENLDEFMNFMVNKFPKIKHYVFNGLDPGNADGNLRSRAGENPWIVPRLTKLEFGLNRAVQVLKNNHKTFRIERIPLCYMQGFEEFSTETRKIVKDELYICSFIEKDKENEVRKVLPSMFREKSECCKACKLNKICAGIQKEYVALYGKNELCPVFKDSKYIIDKIKEQ